jgi:hypothetical protein
MVDYQIGLKHAYAKLYYTSRLPSNPLLDIIILYTVQHNFVGHRTRIPSVSL